MRRSKIQQSVFLSVILLAAFSFTAANADTLNGGGTWQSAASWTQSQLVIDSKTPGGTLGTPYWNNYSGDGSKGNVGWCLTGGSSVCTMSGAPGTALPYFGNGTAAVANMYFTSSGSPISLTVDGIHTNETIAEAYDVFGYYVVPTSGSPTLHALFTTNPGSSPASVGSTASFIVPSGSNYGYYIENIKGGGTPLESDYIFYMNDAFDQELSLGPDGLQHFAVFQNGASYIIGDIDGVGCTNNVACVAPVDFDYQDILVTAVNTPEPTTIGLMGTSLLLLGGFVGRKLRKRS
jgi:hypothetical protein